MVKKDKIRSGFYSSLFVALLSISSTLIIGLLHWGNNVNTAIASITTQSNDHYGEINQRLNTIDNHLGRIENKLDHRK